MVLPAFGPADEPVLRIGFAESDITPKLGEKPVYIAGFGQNRKATAVHDPLRARAAVVDDGKRKIAIVSLDLVSFFHPNVERVRCALCDFDHVLVSSTHNHQGPDTIGLWGPHPFKSGVDPAYIRMVEDRIIEAVQQADRARQPVTAEIGTASAPELLHDSREPYVKHDELVAIRFHREKSDTPAGIIVQWNCHPETLDSKNTEISGDFVAWTVRELHERYRCPVLYLTGTVGGLMTSLRVPIADEQGKALADGTFEKTERYGRAVGRLAVKALEKSRPVKLSPIQVRTRTVFLPLENKIYLLGRQLGVLERPAFVWKGDPSMAEPLTGSAAGRTLALRTEVGWLRLGDLDIACIPGEIYPELVLGKVQDPADAGADFPDAPVEPGIYAQLPGPHRMIVGLAGDEIGYIIPKRQWDEKPPFCYGRPRPQYGESNSVGPETAPILCKAFADLVKGK
jgi:hypothetical protein